jgi:hypothetical protein
MKVILTGTNHSKDEEEIDVVVEYAGIAHDDDWTFIVGDIEFTISNLTTTMEFLKKMD